MALTQKAKTELLQARQLNIEPYQKDGRVLVRTSRVAATYRVLVDATGSVTAAGKHWEDASGEPLLSKTRLGQTFAPTQETVKRGASDTIALRNGQQVVVRTWDASGKYKYTATGKRYYAKRKSEYIVEVPVLILGRRSAQEQGRASRERESKYTRYAYMPVSQFGVSAIFANSSQTPAQLEKRIKDAVLSKLAYVVGENNLKIIHEESQEQWTLDETEKWRYSELTVLQNDGGGGKHRGRDASTA